MAFSRVSDEHGLDTDVHQRNEELLGLRNRHVVIVYAVEEQRRRLDSRNRANGLMTYMHGGKQYVVIPTNGGYTAMALP